VPAAGGGPLTRLQTIARQATQEREAQLEHCDLCGAPIEAGHRHLMDLRSRELMCSCRPCSILFDREAAGKGHYRLVGDRRLRIEDLELDDVMWEELRLPVDMAFFFRHSGEGRVKAYYPSPMGPTESQLELDAWQALEAANPVLGTLTPDVEALLVNRSLGARQHWIVPIDECYELVGLIRTTWRGFTGGGEVWQAIKKRFEELDRRSRPAGRKGAS
jgi:Family of unknown function (DUF5947)